ncbi:hypothetical protein [Dermabacter vaginalis]|uniref:hypothetical protein n=1 Tax=Dermabacter vaginalis TaxID=1630135 RepID=UPI001EF3D9B8|nr:hypothetical protein [Dermabacter vaginalis]MCG7444467.1 hypothetical protein [Dermabacter vaginalis]
MTYPNSAAPQKSKTLVWVAIGMGIVFVLLLIAGGILAFMLLNGKDKKASEPNEGTSTSAPAPQPKPKPPASDNGGDEPAPKPQPNPGGSQPNPNPAPAPGPNPAPAPGPDPAPQPNPGPNPKPGGPDPAPGPNAGGGYVPPDQVGEFKVDSTLPPFNFGDTEKAYSSPNSTASFWVQVFNDPENGKIWVQDIDATGTQIGNWKCQEDAFADSGGDCYAQGPGGAIILIMASGVKDLNEIAQFGDQLAEESQKPIE